MLYRTDASHPYRSAIGRRLKLSLLTLLTVVLSACGASSGGGGGGGGTTPSTSLASLTLTGADIEQVFNPNVLSYTAVVGFLVDSVAIDASAAAGAATIEVDGTPIGTGLVLALSEGDNVFDVLVRNGTSSRTYAVTVTRQRAQSFAQDAYIKASNVDSSDQFGYSVALSGDTLAVGAQFEDGNGTAEADNSANNAGAVYVSD